MTRYILRLSRKAKSRLYAAHVNSDVFFGRFVDGHMDKMRRAWMVCLDNVEQAQQVQKAQFDKRARKPTYKVGDVVLFKRFIPAPVSKFANHWLGTFRILTIDDTHAEI